MENSNVIISIITGILTVLGTVGAICVAWGKMKQFTQNLKDEFRDLRNDFKDFERNMNFKLGEHDKDIAGLKVNAYGTPGSPMEPNEKGKKLLEESGFNSLYPKIKDKLFSVMDGLNTKTLYDAEKNGFTALDGLKAQDEFIDVKHYAVNNQGESLELIFTVASWVIRDDYAKERGIKK